MLVYVLLLFATSGSWLRATENMLLVCALFREAHPTRALPHLQPSNSPYLTCPRNARDLLRCAGTPTGAGKPRIRVLLRTHGTRCAICLYRVSLLRPFLSLCVAGEMEIDLTIDLPPCWDRAVG